MKRRLSKQVQVLISRFRIIERKHIDSTPQGERNTVGVHPSSAVYKALTFAINVLSAVLSLLDTCSVLSGCVLSTCVPFESLGFRRC